MRDLKWSPAEKAISRRVFGDALEAAFGRILAELKVRAAAAQTPDDIWRVEEFLRDARRDIDRTFDYRYSQLLMVFAQLIREGYTDETRLAGLSDEKRKIIRDLLSLSNRA